MLETESHCMVNSYSSTVSVFHPSSFRVLLTYPQRLKIETLKINDVSNSDVGNSDDGRTLHREALVIATDLLKGPTLKISSDASNRDVELEIATRRWQVREALKIATGMLKIETLKMETLKITVLAIVTLKIAIAENRDVETNAVSNNDVGLELVTTVTR